MFIDRQSVVFNPQLYLEAASHNFITYNLGPIRFTLVLDVTAFKFTPFDAEFLLSLEKPENGLLDMCFGMQYLTDVLDLEVKLNVEVLECQFGLFGISIGDPYECSWVAYDLRTPLAHVHFLNALDTHNNLVSWWCSFEQYQTQPTQDKQDS